MKKINQQKQNKSENLSSKKQNLFWGIMLFAPVLFLILVEVFLQVINYGGNLELFIDGPSGYSDFLRCNPEVARRYFSGENSVPTPPLQLFRKTKAENGFRIFVLGGSSSAGFPYGNNIAFPSILRQKLSRDYQDKEIEVINVAMSAVNSYTINDLLDEVLEQSPDLILIYAGHNEYYGALGVGSAQSLSNFPIVINLYLDLHSVKTFLLLKDIITSLKINIRALFEDRREIDPSNTLMARIVAEQEIVYGSDLYYSGIKQFENNLAQIVEKINKAGVDLILSDLVSNQKDQKPFISVKQNGISADEQFKNASKLEMKGEFLKAKEKYITAKELDALRFRAPEVFNSIIDSIASAIDIPVANTKEIFEKNSPNGIVGKSLILEHLHPTIMGYQLLAESFYKQILKTGYIKNNQSNEGAYDDPGRFYTALDSCYGELVVRHLKEGWPFKKNTKENLFMKTFRPENKIEEVAFKVLRTQNFNIESGHMELGEYYEERGELAKSFDEYYALICSIPHEILFYERAVTVLLKMKKYDKALVLLEKSLSYKQSDFANKWIGQIALIKKEYKKSINFLLKADKNEPQTLFNLSRAYYLDNQWKSGEAAFRSLTTISPNSHYLPYLKKIRAVAKLKGANIQN